MVLAGVVTAQQTTPAVTQPLGPVTAPTTAEQAEQQAQAVMEYWTSERMASAQAMPIPTRLITDSAAPGGEVVTFGDPGFVNGWIPGGAAYVEQRQTFSSAHPQSMMAPQTFGVAPTNPRDGPYGPFQRWTMEGSYNPAWRAIHGKLFFTLSGLNYVCSGTVINRSVVATAGHCVAAGNGSTWASNWLFCPSYGQSGPMAGRGCWAWSSVVTSAPWFFSGDPDYDYACLVTPLTGTVVANKIGNVTGWAGRAWNWVDVPEMIFGYPAAAPFAGNIIEQVATVDWYNWDATPGSQVSKVVGNDLTGGSSGGGWFIGWRAPGAEVADTDGSNNTDPGTAGPFINGVNSHKRCVTNCNTPPTTTAGVFWQEMTSPPFRSDANDASDSEDIFAICNAHTNNN
jgi:V8-like Glu-specific endopeptidase